MFSVSRHAFLKQVIHLAKGLLWVLVVLVLEFDCIDLAFKWLSVSVH